MARLQSRVHHQREQCGEAALRRRVLPFFRRRHHRRRPAGGARGIQSDHRHC
ncbi:MAG TPA: hypothetical protein VIL07_11545 [Symbiobacteriaceae bacterium]